MERRIKYSGGTININIRDTGIYSMGVNSSNGKSHLYHVLDGIDDKAVLALTYDRKLDYINILSNLSSDILIIYIDRFDMIINKEIAAVLSSIKNRYIILDFKDEYNSPILSTKFLVITKNGGNFTLYG